MCICACSYMGEARLCMGWDKHTPYSFWHVTYIEVSQCFTTTLDKNLRKAINNALLLWLRFFKIPRHYYKIPLKTVSNISCQNIYTLHSSQKRYVLPLYIPLGRLLKQWVIQISHILAFVYWHAYSLLYISMYIVFISSSVTFILPFYLWGFFTSENRKK